MSSGEREGKSWSESTDASEERVVPTGRDARLWRVLVELSLSVGEARADSNGSSRPKPFVPGQLENLVVEFDDAYTIFVEGMERLPTEAQLVALQSVDRTLAAMVRAQEAELWTHEALREDPRWLEIERLSVCVIEAFGWPLHRLVLVAPRAVSEVPGSGRSSGSASGPRRSS